MSDFNAQKYVITWVILQRSNFLKSMWNNQQWNIKFIFEHSADHFYRLFHTLNLLCFVGQMNIQLKSRVLKGNACYWEISQIHIINMKITVNRMRQTEYACSWITSKNNISCLVIKIGGPSVTGTQLVSRTDT